MTSWQTGPPRGRGDDILLDGQGAFNGGSAPRRRGRHLQVQAGRDWLRITPLNGNKVGILREDDAMTGNAIRNQVGFTIYAGPAPP
jgi:hypothetical protein